ncbi:MAG: glycerophosphodiester phosphodiesterase family protein [Pseudomonadota bacterium]
MRGENRIQPKFPGKRRVRVWRAGHRGFPYVAPENTLASFEAAVRAGVDMIEFDVTLSRDGVPVVLHDRTLNRTTDGRGSPRRRVVSELKSLDAGGWFARAYRGERIPTLDETLKFLKGRVAVNVEIKIEAVSWRAAGGIEEKVVKALRASGMAPYSVVSSFFPLAVRRVKRIAPEQSAALLISRPLRRDPLRLASRVRADALHLAVQLVDRELIIRAREAGLPIRVFTVNRLPDMRRLAAWGVDGVFSDRADRLARL